MRPFATAVLAVAIAAAGAAPAQAAKTCREPGPGWDRATPEEAGMDRAKLQDALDYGTSQLGFAVRVYRRGCLVGEDRLAAVNRNQQFESWSMAKSVTALLFGRAMTLGLVSPDDPVGSLVPDADREHGEILLDHLLRMTSGLKWNGWRDYNIFTMEDRVRDALTLEVVHEPGTYYEYAQSAVSLLAATVGRAAGERTMDFARRTLMREIGIRDHSWDWTHDRAGNLAGFYGVHMRPDDFGRLGELMRRGGVWRGKRLLSREFVRRALEPAATNGCYGWLIWLNAAVPCIGPTITDRPVRPNRRYPGLPADIYNFSGLFGQLVAVFPSQGIVVVRTGQDPGLVFSGGTSWEYELYRRVLDAVTDQEIPPSGDPPSVSEEHESADYGFQTALREPDEYSKGFQQDPLPPAGPARARAAQLAVVRRRPGRRNVLAVRLSCPPQWPAPGLRRCRGVARMSGAVRRVRYSVAAGKSKRLRFRLAPSRLLSLRRTGRAPLTVRARNADAADGTVTRIEFVARARRR